MISARLFTAAIALPLFISTSVSAHGLWTEHRRGNIEVVFGEGAEDDAFDPASVTESWAYGADGKPVSVKIDRLKDHARLVPASEAAVTAVAFDAGVWSEKADGKWENKGRTEIKDAKQALHALKYSVALNGPYQQLPAMNQLGLVIVPEVDPSTLKPGQSLPVKVLNNGKPLADVSVFGDYRGAPTAVSGKTNAEGRVSIPIRNVGLNVLAAEASVPVKGDKNVDSNAYFTSLTFVGAPHAE